MAIGRIGTREVNWSEFQDNQLRALNNLNKSFQDNLTQSKTISRSLDYTAKAITAIATQILPQRSRALAGEIDTLSKSISRSSLSFSDLNSMTNSRISVEDAARIATEERTRAENDAREKAEKSSKSVKERLGEFSQALEVVSSVLNKLGQEANKYSALSNELIRISGLSGDSVRNFRNDLDGVVTTLNDDLGKAYFNVEKSYESMVSIAKSVTGDLDAVREMSKPLLLADKSMSTDINSIAKLFNKMYTRYNFTSATMEEMVSDIRKYSAGNSSSADDMVAAQNQLHDIMIEYAGGDESKYLQMSSTLDKTIGFLAAMGVDSPTTIVSDLFTAIANGDLDSLAKYLPVLTTGGLGADISALPKLLGTPEGMSKILSAFLAGTTSLYGSSNGYWGAQQVSSIFGMDINQARGLNNAIGGYSAADIWNMIENYEPENADATLEDQVGDQFISVEERIENRLSSIYEMLAGWQEKLGIAWTDIGAIAGLLATFIASKSALSIFGEALSSAGLSLTGGGAGGLAGALGIGATAVGIAAILGTIYVGLKEAGNIKEKTYSEMLEEIDEGVEAGTTYGLDTSSGTPHISANAPARSREDILSFYEDYAANQALDYGNSGLVKGDYLGNFGKAFVGSGWWSGGKGQWYDYLPLGIGSAVRGVTGLAEYADAGSKTDATLDIIDAISNLTDKELEVYNAYYNLYPDISEVDKSKRIQHFAKNKDFLTTLYENPVLWEDLYQRGELKGYAAGTNYIPEDQLALLHKGEAVVPKDYNPAANMTELEALREQDDRQREEAREEARQTIGLLAQTASTLSEMKTFFSTWKLEKERTDTEMRTFLSTWKLDNERNELIRRMTSTTSNQEVVNNYLVTE